MQCVSEYIASNAQELLRQQENSMSELQKQIEGAMREFLDRGLKEITDLRSAMAETIVEAQQESRQRLLKHRKLAEQVLTLFQFD